MVIAFKTIVIKSHRIPLSVAKAKKKEYLLQSRRSNIIHSCIHPCNNSLLFVYVTESVLGSGDIMMNQTTHRLCLHTTYCLVKEIDVIQVITRTEVKLIFCSMWQVP